MFVSLRTAADADEHETHSCHIEEHRELRTLFTRVLELALASITDEETRLRLESTRRYVHD